jgi:hypothetical protein
MMPAPELPLFPVTVVGSWSRPPWLLDSLRRRQAGRITEAEFTDVADRAVLEALRYQDDAGVDVVSDGEQRRDNFHLPLPPTRVEPNPASARPASWGALPDPIRFDHPASATRPRPMVFPARGADPLTRSRTGGRLGARVELPGASSYRAAATGASVRGVWFHTAAGAILGHQRAPRSRHDLYRFEGPRPRMPPRWLSRSPSPSPS